jgi:membrane protein implicated in regulation of membrane protease activity
MFGLSWIEVIYWVSAIVGGTLLLLRMLMLLFGGGDFGENVDGEVPGDAADVSFKFLSLQGLTSFFMMFGLVGLALLKAGVHILLTVVGGMVAGVIMVATTSLIFSQMKRLQTEGTINIRNTIGTEGSVYLTIPKNGSGQVQIIVQGSLKIFDASSNGKAALSTGEKVRVVDVAGGNTLVVEKIK